MPPLNAAIGDFSLSASVSIAIPRGGRPLVMVNSMPADRNRSTASRARGVRTLAFVTNVPSTSAMSSLIGVMLASQVGPSASIAGGRASPYTEARNDPNREVLDQRGPGVCRPGPLPGKIGLFEFVLRNYSMYSVSPWLRNRLSFACVYFRFK